MTIKTVGLDLAKDVFQVHRVSATGRPIINKKIKRAKLLAFFETLPRCVVGMEACGSAHHLGRELRKLGHDVRLMPAAYVRPYVMRGKTDTADAEVISEAVRRPTMRFVEIKSEDQQVLLANHWARDLVVRQSTQVVNMIRSILREFGHILPTGIEAESAFARKQGTADQLEMSEIGRGKKAHLHRPFKRTSLPCKSPAVRGWNASRMHGARGGAPKGILNRNYRHGAKTKEIEAELLSSRLTVGSSII